MAALPSSDRSAPHSARSASPALAFLVSPSRSVAVPASIRRPLLLRSLAQPEPRIAYEPTRRKQLASWAESEHRRSSTETKSDIACGAESSRELSARRATASSRSSESPSAATTSSTASHSAASPPSDARASNGTSDQRRCPVCCDRPSKFARSSANRCGSSLRASSQATTAARIAGRMLAYPRRPPKSLAMSPANAVSRQRSSLNEIRVSQVFIAGASTPAERSASSPSGVPTTGGSPSSARARWLDSSMRADRSGPGFAID